MQFFPSTEPEQRVICIAISNFIPPSSLSIPSTSKAINFLPFYVGERIQIIKHCDNWCFGQFEADPTQTGIFPSCFVEALDEENPLEEDEDRRFSSSTFDSAKESKQLLSEITETLKAWWKFLKKDYSCALLDSEFRKYEDSIKDLILIRKRILSGNIPTEELKELRQSTARKIDVGSHSMGLSMPIRDEAARILRIDNLSVISSYREHEKAYAKIISDNFNEDPQTSILFINLNQIDFKLNYDCELTILLWDNESKKALTESIVFKWDKKDKKFIHQNLSGMFVGLNVAELAKESFELTATITVNAPIDITLSAMNGKPPKNIVGDPICVRQPLAQGSLKLADKLKDILDKEKRELRLSFKPLMQIEKFKVNQKSELFIEFTIARLTGTSIEEIEIRHPEIFNPKPTSILRLNPSSTKEIIEEGRNEVYLKIGASDFHGGKYSDKNIEILLKVYDDEGNPKPGCFVTTTPDKIEYKDIYRSCVYCSEDRPIFNEMIKISLPFVLTKDLHIRILYYHRRTSDKSDKDKKPFGVSWLRLIHKGVLEKPTSDELVIYKIEKYEEHILQYIRMATTKTELKNFQQLPYKQENQNVILNEKNTIFFETTVLSSILTTNFQLRYIITHREENREVLGFINTLIKMDDANSEILKFLPDFCDSLFQVLVSDQETTRETVFNALVHVIRLCEDSENEKFFIEYLERFHSANVFQPLLQILIDRIDMPPSPEGTVEPLVPILRSLKYLTITIIESQQCYNLLTPGENPICISESFIELFNKLKILVQDSSKKRVCQNTAIKYIPTMFQPLLDNDTFETDYLANYILDILENLSPNVITRERITFLSEIVATDIFEDPECVSLLLPKFLDIIITEMEPCPAGNIRSDFDTDTYLETAKLCSKVLSDIVEKLFPFSQIKSVHQNFHQEELEHIIFKTIRVVNQTVILLLARDPIRIRPVHALLLALLDKFSTQIFVNFLGNLHNLQDRIEMCSEMLHMFHDLVEQCPFPAEWYQMRYLQYKLFMKHIRFIKAYILKYCYEDEDLTIHIEFFKTVSSIIQKIIPNENTSIYNSEIRLLRKIAAVTIRSMWFSMEAREKPYLMERILGDLLPVTLADDPEIRATIIPIYYDMLLNEKENTFVQDFILHLDPQLDAGLGSTAFRSQFREELSHHCSKDDFLQLEFVERIDRLLELLLNLRKVKNEADCIESGKLCTVQLINFYMSINQNELIVHHLQSLYSNHLESGSDVEAGFTLLQFADHLDWSNDPIPDYITRRSYHRGCSTQLQLREKLFIEIADLFDNGEHWERAIEVLKQLFPVYENSLFDYGKVAELHRRMGNLFDKINKEIRTESFYFLVIFCGNGFPEYLGKKKFIFRGEKLEMLGQFKERIMGKFYGAQSIDTIDISDNLMNAEGKFIQIIPVTPIRSPKFLQLSNGNVNIRWYYKHHDIYQFQHLRSERRDKTKWTKKELNDGTRLWIHRKIYTVSNVLPGILNFSEVEAEEEGELENPVVVGIRKIEEVNTNLRETAELVAAGYSQYFIPLGGCIRGVLQADVGGGIRNYDTFFSDEIKAEATPDEIKLISRLRRLLLHHVTILEYCLCIHASKPTLVNESFHAALVDLFLEYRQRIETKFGPAPSLLHSSNSIHLPSSGVLAAAATTSSQSFTHASSSSLSLEDSATDKHGYVLLRAVPSSAATLIRSTMSRTKLVTPHHKKSTGNSFSISDFDHPQQQNITSEAQSKIDNEMLQQLRKLDSRSFLTSPEPPTSETNNIQISNSQENGNYPPKTPPPPLPYRKPKFNEDQQKFHDNNAL